MAAPFQRCYSLGLGHSQGNHKHLGHSAKHKIGDVGFEVGVPFGVRDLKKEMNLDLKTRSFWGPRPQKVHFL